MPALHGERAQSLPCTSKEATMAKPYDEMTGKEQAEFLADLDLHVEQTTAQRNAANRRHQATRRVASASG